MSLTSRRCLVSKGFQCATPGIFWAAVPFFFLADEIAFSWLLCTLQRYKSEQNQWQVLILQYFWATVLFVHLARRQVPGVGLRLTWKCSPCRGIHWMLVFVVCYKGIISISPCLDVWIIADAFLNHCCPSELHQHQLVCFFPLVSAVFLFLYTSKHRLPVTIHVFGRKQLFSFCTQLS